MGKRANGLGSVSKTADGRFWARGPNSQGRPSWGYFDTEEAANRKLIAQLEVREENDLRRDATQPFLEFGQSVLDVREKGGVRGIDSERRYFRTHLATAHFALKPIDQVTAADIARWLREMGEKKARRGSGAKDKSYSLDRPLAWRTVVRAFTILTAIFDAAKDPERNLIASNPCDGLEVKKRAGKEATKDVEVFLTIEEQKNIRECPLIPDDERYFILFAYGSGVRRGEQYNVELTDVDVEKDPHVTVRFGSDGLPPKNGLVQTIPLFGYALEAARWQLRHLDNPKVLNPLGLLWPTKHGHRRRGKPLGGHFRPVEKGGSHVIVSGKPKRVKRGTGTHVYVDRFKELLGFAGITRRVRWHDLRHTCASALLQGQWGDAWTLAEVKEQLRHSSVTVTERYAKLGQTALKKAAKKVTVEVSPLGGSLVAEAGPKCENVEEVPEKQVEPRVGLEPTTCALRKQNILDMLRALASENSSDNQLVTNLAAALAAALESGKMPP